MMDQLIGYQRPRGGMSTGVGRVLALALPLLGAITVIGIYLGKEVIVAAGFVGLFTLGVMLAQPVVGVITLTAGLLLVAYPTFLQQLGFLTFGNLFGICLAVQLGLRVLGTRDLSFLRVPQVVLLFVIGLLFVASVVHADAIFPTLQVTGRSGAGPRAILDKTPTMMNNFWTRLALLIFICAFVRRGGDVRALFLAFVGILFLAVPSALINWWQGELFRGFRATASVTAGANANRLAMICLVEIACAWFWAVSAPGSRRRLLAGVVIVASVLVLFATGSRTGLIGTALLVVLLQSGSREFRVPTYQVGVLALFAMLTIAFVAPPEAWERMTRFSTDDPHAPGYTSTVKREATLSVGWQMVRDHGVMGVGLGNFQEVARQVYDDEYYKPTHNSYLWAAVEGGIFCIACYLALLWITWREIGVIMRLAKRDPDMAYLAPCLRTVFVLHCFFSAFADLWLNPITYALLGLVITMRRYLESLAVEAPKLGVPPRLALSIAR